MDPVMREVGEFFGGFFDQLNPYNSANLIAYFTWLIVYVTTWITVWRSSLAWLRFISFLVNQVFSVGILISWSLVILIAVRFWIPSLIVALLTAGLALLVFRKRQTKVAAA